MKDIQDVLKQKESELQQLQREIEALRVAARLLADDGDAPVEALKPAVGAPSAVPTVPRPAPAAAAAANRPGAYSAAWENSPKQFP
jgi:hypothetical protein